jgi:hypothetical protein
LPGGTRAYCKDAGALSVGDVALKASQQRGGGCEVRDDDSE